MEKFKQKVEDAYGVGAYDLKHVQFKGNKVPVLVWCPEHGFFSITPDNFIYNAGCPKCRGHHPRGYPKRVIEKNPLKTPKRGPKPKMCRFYIQDVGGEFLKIGITQGSVENRRIGVERASVYKHTVVFCKEFETRKIALAVEKLIKSLFPMRVVAPGNMYDGISETTHIKHLDEIIGLVETIPADVRQ